VVTYKSCPWGCRNSLTPWKAQKFPLRILVFILHFSFYTSVASVFSSKIEGADIQLDSYKHKRFGIEFLPDYTRKIYDLYGAYDFAKTKKLATSGGYCG